MWECPTIEALVVLAARPVAAAKFTAVMGLLAAKGFFLWMQRV
jgi:hypothetical protein